MDEPVEMFHSNRANTHYTKWNTLPNSIGSFIMNHNYSSHGMCDYVSLLCRFHCGFTKLRFIAFVRVLNNTNWDESSACKVNFPKKISPSS